MTRGLQGLGFGGEWAVGAVLMGEAIRAQYRGKAVGTVQGGWAVGWGIAALCYTVLFSILPAATSWRAMFCIGILPSLLVFYIRRSVPEPEVFHRTRAREAVLGEGSHFLEIFSPTLPENHPSDRTASDRGTRRLLRHHNLVAHISEDGARPIRCSTPVVICSTLILFAVCSLLTVVAYSYLPVSHSAMLALGFPLGFFASGSFSPVGAFFTELFPSRLRGSGQGFSYNLGRGIGALFPTLVGYLTRTLALDTPFPRLLWPPTWP
jgi:MFS family permease